MTREEKEHQLEEFEAQKDAGAIFVSGENAKLRKRVCSTCEHRVNLAGIIPMIKIYACGICKCPLNTKAHFKKHFSMSEQKVIKTVCVHPDGNKWEDVDNACN